MVVNKHTLRMLSPVVRVQLSSQKMSCSIPVNFRVLKSLKRALVIQNISMSKGDTLVKGACENMVTEKLWHVINTLF